MARDILDAVDGGPIGSGRADGPDAPWVEPGSDWELLDPLSQIENRIGALEGRITLQRLWVEQRRVEGRDRMLMRSLCQLESPLTLVA